MTEVFVFGSNLAGRHGKGAAKDALENHGAIYGQGEGLQGNSYAIPTKDENLKPIALQGIDMHIHFFLRFAKMNPEKRFLLTPIGCGLAGNSKREIWAILQDYGVPSNVYLTSTWVTP
tara:strand:- start:390 stop:743 length:354 start_codon:yes stop_codon:yes gene_type:complete